MWNNNSGYSSGISPTVAYCTWFRELRNVYERKIDPNMGNKYSPAALWCLQMAHQTKLHPITERRNHLIDKAYTRNVIVKKLLILTDNESRMLGTGRYKM